MSIAQQAIVKAVNDLTDSLPATGKMAVLEHLLGTVGEKDLRALSTEGRQQLLSLYPEVPASGAQPSSSFATRIDDSTFAFKVLGDPNQSQENHIYAKLGEDASSLIDNLKLFGVQLDQGKVPEHSKAVISSASNNKTYSEQKGFYADGLAGPSEAVNIAMEAVCAAKEAGIDLRTINGESYANKGVRVESEAVAKGLGEGTVAVLKMLTEGTIRFDNGSRSGALMVSADGGLRAGGGIGSGDPIVWAFGASPSAESK